MATQKSAKPTLSEWLDTVGITARERETGSQALYDAIGTYNMIGLEEDNRDWKAIMSSPDPEQAAFQATAQAYGGSGTVNLTKTGGMLTSPGGTPLTSELGAYRQFGIQLKPADLLAQLNTISRATPAGRAKYDEINNLYQQALADQKSAGLLGSSVNYLLKDTATKTKVEDVDTDDEDHAVDALRYLLACRPYNEITRKHKHATYDAEGRVQRFMEKLDKTKKRRW